MANYLDLTTGLPSLWAKIKALIPTKTSDLTNDSSFITPADFATDDEVNEMLVEMGFGMLLVREEE